MAPRVTEQQLLAIYWESVDALYSYVSRRCGGQRDLAEDVTQEAWLRAVREWSRKGLPASPIAWLTTVARNLLVDQLRRAEPVPIDPETMSEVLASDGDAVAESAEVAAAVTRALAKIPSAEAELLEAFHFERRKVAQIAESKGVSERAIEGRLRRARERLRRELEITMKGIRGIA
jgi:RNA polymerase sigma-70 factor (ECF subfamily)